MTAIMATLHGFIKLCWSILVRRISICNELIGIVAAMRKPWRSNSSARSKKLKCVTHPDDFLSMGSDKSVGQ
jgi:hypothetical protein